jgi:WD40 repeat protein
LLARTTVAGNLITATVLALAPGPPDPVDAIAISPDGRTLASASTDDMVQLWDISNPRNPASLATLPGHTQAVISVAFSSDGNTLASSADDDTIRLWNVSDPRTPSPLATLTGLGSPTSVTFEPGSHTVAGAAADGTALFWDTEANSVANRICASRPAGDVPDLIPYLLGVTYRPVCPAARA